MAAAPVTAPTLMHSSVSRPMACSDASSGTLASLAARGGKRVHGDADARRDRSANVITVLIDDVDIGRGAKVHHDCRRAVESLGRNGVGDAIGTYGLGARPRAAWSPRPSAAR